MTDTTITNLHPLAVLGRSQPQGSLQGYCSTTYDNLVALLGEPHSHNGDKTTVEWSFRCHDGTKFHVYDWKLEATPICTYDWHIGGTGHPLEAFERHTGLRTISAANYHQLFIEDHEQL